MSKLERIVVTSPAPSGRSSDATVISCSGSTPGTAASLSKSSVDFAAKLANFEGKYLVEKILNRRAIKGKVHYLIKWKGFTDQVRF